MNIKFLGHAAFILTSSKGTKLLTDPYELGCFDGVINYQPITEAVDVITISHDHADHNYIAPCHNTATIISKAGSHQFKDVEIFGTKTFHDTKQGQERGDNIVFTIRMDDIVVCHLGDLGHTLSAAELKVIGKIDVLLLPVGGLYTIDAAVATKVMQLLNPKICIPMHYKTNKIAMEFAPVTAFTKGKANVKKIDGSAIELTKANLPQMPEIWVLTHAK